MRAHCDKLSIRFKTHIRPKVSSECSKVYNNIIDGISKICCKMDFSDYYDEQHDTGVVKMPINGNTAPILTTSERAAMIIRIKRR